MESERIADLIERVVEGDPWHGPSVAVLLRDVTATNAARPGPGGAHGVWALVLHMTGWAREVTARLGGRAAQDPDEGDWPSIGEPTEDRWEAARTALFEIHRQLARRVRELEEPRLAAPVSDFRDNALGTGLSHYLTLHGLVHHTVYHAGQIAVVKRTLG